MFTGIITDIGRIESAEQRGDLRLRIACAYDMDGVDLGASIACSGVCLTVVDKGGDWFAVDISGETRSRSAPGLWQAGARLNLERSLRLGDELGGHIVTGHVDAVGEVEAAVEVGGSVRLTVIAPAELEGYIAPKGSISLDGVSLTVNEAGPDRFACMLIPHTWDHTALGQLRPGDRVNLEADMLARYVARQLAFQGRDAGVQR